MSQDAIKDKKLTIVETKQKLQTGPAKNLHTPHQSFGIFTLKFMTLGVNFTNILQTAFAYKSSQKHKKTDGLTVFFALLGSALVKAAHKHVGEIAPLKDEDQIR